MPKGRPDKGYALTPQRVALLRILVAAGGTIDDGKGFVVSNLRQQIGYDNTQALSMVINQLEKAGLIRREVVGRRTYHLELVEDAVAPEDRAVIGLPERKKPAVVQVPRPVRDVERELADLRAEVERLTRIIVRQSEMLAQV